MAVENLLLPLDRPKSN